jgi:AraC-like DNA-binding protein
MLYRETMPTERFAEYIKCFWSLEDSPATAVEPEPVVPDGCIEIVFNLSDRFHRHYQSGEVEMQPASLVAGQMDRGILIRPSGAVKLFGIRFKPAGAYPFFSIDLGEIFGRIVDLDALWTRSAEIEERLSIARTFEAQVLIAETALWKRMNEKLSVDKDLGYAVGMIAFGNGTRQIRKVAREIGISERGLERRFRRYVGIRPKMFSRITRFQRVLAAIESSHKPNVLETALAFGYFDQSHLINDFHQFSGTSPAVFLERSRGITDLFLAGA